MAVGNLVVGMVVVVDMVDVGSIVASGVVVDAVDVVIANGLVL